MLPRWRWSISKAFGRVTDSDLMLASPGRVFEFDREAWVLASLGSLAPTELGDRHLRSEGERKAVGSVEVGAETRRRTLVADPFRADREGRAVGRVDHEIRLVDIDLDRAQTQRNAADDLRHGFGVGDHVGVERVDVKSDPDDDGAVVIWSGERGSYRH